ncbi:MAG: glycosyltransferase family 4 protein [Caldilineales bacterium]|nr:glycosyltransferase family 4 protein [Caldilineales bacterium]MDW8318583.1 glycosyltransferase family 4 protein [Anaerolineae bacterium]
MKRILLVDLAPSPGGSIVSLLQLVAHLDREAFAPTMVLSHVLRHPALDALGVPLVRLRTPWWEQPTSSLVQRVRRSAVGDAMRSHPARAWLWHRLGDLRRLVRDLLPAAWSMVKVIRRTRPDLVHLNDALPLVRPALLACRLTRTPALAHVRSFLLPSRLDAHLLAPGLVGLIFNSQAVANAQLAALPRPPLHQVIPNAVDLAEFSRPVDCGRVRQELGVPPDAPLVGMFGRIAPWKGQTVFVEAMARVAAQLPTARGWIVGGAEGESGAAYLQQVQTALATHGLTDRVRLLGHRDDVPRLMAAVDAVAHCSVEPEPFGRVIIEGMAAGRPVVASAAGGAAEIVTSGVDGLLTPPGDAGALADALLRVLTDPATARRLAQAARRTVAQRYTVDAHVAAVQAFYRRLLA